MGDEYSLTPLSKSLLNPTAAHPSLTQSPMVYDIGYLRTGASKLHRPIASNPTDQAMDSSDLHTRMVSESSHSPGPTNPSHPLDVHVSVPLPTQILPLPASHHCPDPTPIQDAMDPTYHPPTQRQVPLASTPPQLNPIPSAATPTQDPMDPTYHPPSQRPPTHTPFTPYTAAPQMHPVDQYSKYLRAYYRRGKLPIHSKWPPTASKKYIHLAVVKKDYVSKQQAYEFTRATLHGDIEDIIREKESLDFSGIGKKEDGSPAQLIIVEGGPGIGKTTFAWKVCRKWSKGKILQQYRLVVLLRLRDKRVREARNVHDLFYHSNPKLREAVAAEMEAINGESVLLLYEGYDELPGKLQMQQSIFLDILYQECLPEATVLITSRPSATQFLCRQFKKSIDQHIEILGFTKADVQSYVQSVIKDQQLNTEFTQYLKCYPHIRGLMYVPLNAVIVTEIYKTTKLDKSQDFVPTTLTELYTSLSRGMLLRYLTSHNEYGQQEWKLSSFSDLPEELNKQFYTICGIAFQGILKDEFIFDDLARDFNTLDLMQSAAELYVDQGAVVSHNFFHLTLQEFLAAVHVSQRSEEEQLQYFIQSTPTWIKQLEEEQERDREQERERERERKREREREREQQQQSIISRIEQLEEQRERLEREQPLEQEEEYLSVVSPTGQLPSPRILPLLFERPLTPDLESITKPSTSMSEGLAIPQSQSSLPQIQLQQVLETLRLQGLQPQSQPTMEHSIGTSLPTPRLLPDLQLAERKPLPREGTPQVPQTTLSLTTQDQGRLELLQAPHPTSSSTHPQPYINRRLQSSIPSWTQTHQLQGLIPVAESTTQPPAITPEPPTLLVPCVSEAELMVTSALPRPRAVVPELQLSERNPLPLQETPQVPQTTPSLTTQDQGRLEPLQVPMTPRPPSESTPPRPESPAIPDTADIGRLQLETPQLEPSEPQQLLSQREIPPITNPRPVIPHTLPVSPLAGSLPYAVLTSSHFQNVVKFTAGLTKLNGIPIASLKSILLQGWGDRQVIPLYSLLQDRGDRQVMPLYSLHWLFEAQCISKYSEMIAETTALTFNHINSGITPFDCFVLGYALSHINCTWDINIWGSLIGDEGLEMMVAGMTYKETTLPPSLKSIILDLSHCAISSVGLSHLKEMPEQVATRITELYLWGNTDISEGVASLLSNLTSLKRLHLGATSISTQEVELLAELLSHSQSHKLEYLNLGDSLKSPESTSLILTALSNNTTLREIRLWEAHVSENNLSLLTSALRTNTTLRKLDLSRCKINDNMVSEITSALCVNSTLQTLDLIGNAIGPGGATALAEMLRRNKTLQEMDVRDNAIGEEGTLKLASSLEHNETLEKLVIERKYEHSLPPELPLKTQNRITSSYEFV